LRRAHPEARVIAGGTDVVVELSHAQKRPSHFLSLARVAELSECSESDEAFVIGAGATLARIAHSFGTRIPLLASLWPLFASLPIRTRATLGGNLVTASPVGDGAPILLALGAELVLASASAQRTLPLADFFTGYRKTALASDELLIAIRIPKRTPSQARFYKVTKRPLDDISAVAAAFVLQVHEGRISEARLAFGGVAATPVRATDAEAELIGKPFATATQARVRAALAASFAPIDDQRASAAYRRALVTSLWDKFCQEVAP
jgi:xanthine dehydrogenase small subunit